MTFALAALLSAAVALAEGPPLVLTGGTIVDVSAFGRSALDVPDSVIVIRGTRIVAAGPRKTVKIPAGAPVIPIDGAYVLPGLNDVFAGMNSQAQANAYLYMGVTSIVGSDEPGGRRGALFTSARPSPRVRRLGVVTGVRGGGNEPVKMKTAEVLEQVDEVARQGAEVLLLYYPLTPEDTRQVVRRAHKLGLATSVSLAQRRTPRRSGTGSTRSSTAAGTRWSSPPRRCIRRLRGSHSAHRAPRSTSSSRNSIPTILPLQGGELAWPDLAWP